MAARRKTKKDEKAKRPSVLAPLRAACLVSVSLDTLILAMPAPRPAPRDTVHYYKDGHRFTVGVDHGL